MPNPKVSIIIATWNRPHLISGAIASVLKQTFSDWELLVVGDGSPEETAAVVREWQGKDPRIKYFPIAHTGRIASVSNVGLDRARGEYIAILDDDDWWTDSQKLEKQVAFLDAHSDYVACGGGVILVDEEGNETSRALKPESDAAIRKVLLFANPIVNSTALFRRSAALTAGRYDESLAQFADWDFWLTLGKLGKLHNFPDYFAAYRIHPGSSSFMKQRENALCAVTIVKDHRGEYRGFLKGLAYAYGYLAYTALPLSFRRATYAFLSGLKKKIFAK